MNIEKKKLKEIKPNPANPRVIHDSQFHRLVNSLLSLPKMLELRPIVTDTNMIVLGGNQRLRALQSIAAMSDDELKERISQVPDFQKKKKEEQDALVCFWLAWLDNPVCPSVKADELTDEEQRKFIIVDNAGFGEWDFDMLKQSFDLSEVSEWGIEPWKIKENSSSGNQNEETEQFYELPEELQGLNIEPDELPKIEGDDETAMERIIIVYQKDRSEDVAKFFGIEKIDKVVYNLEELGI